MKKTLLISSAIALSLATLSCAKTNEKTHIKNENNEINYANKFIEIKSEINDFINDKLSAKEYEYSRDILQSNLDKINYNILLNKNIDSTDYKNYYEKMNSIFKDVKLNYKNYIQNVNDDSEESNEDKDKKEDKNSNEKTLTNYEENLKSNIEANDFINLINKDEILDIEYIGYTKENKQKIKEFTENLIKGLEKDDQKIKVIFDYIAENVKYATNPKIQPAIEPYDVLKRKVAVCGGYSNLYKAMLDSVGIKNSIVIGWSKYGDHQWNLVYDSFNNIFFHSDPTWGKGYFRKNEKDFAKDHRTFKLIDTYFQKDNIFYEYDRGVSVYSGDKNKEYEDSLSVSLPVKNISENYLKTVEILTVKNNIVKINYLGGSYNVKKINVSLDNKVFSSLNGVLYNKDFSALLKVPEKYESTELLIPKTVREIEDEKLSLNAKSLAKIEVEAGNYKFREYGNILYNNDLSEIIYIPNKSPKIVITSDNLKLKAHDFSFNNNIEVIVLSKNVRDIPEFAFNNLTKLKTIIFNGEIDSFSANAFVNIEPNNINLVFKNKVSDSVLKTIEKLKIKYEILSE